MRSPARFTLFVAALLCSGSLFAKAPASAPAGTTGQCNDGSYSSSAEKSGACSGHGGVKKWFGATAATTGSGPAHEGSSSAKPSKSKIEKDSASGGGSGQVWVNKDTKVYHCRGDKWYGKTAEGAYMTESNAVAQGYRADHGKACQ